MLNFSLRDDNTGENGTAYTGAVNDDIIQNAMPIPTSTILIIFLILRFRVCLWGIPRDGPGTSHSYTTRE